jgi:peptidyl-prolyl cis-trans isomerase A (cyclophilin A)
MTTHTHVASIKTNHGVIKVNLFALHAPKTVEKFVGLATGTIDWVHPSRGPQANGTPLYNGVIFHRIIHDFMSQGGDPNGTGMGGHVFQFGD